MLIMPEPLFKASVVEIDLIKNISDSQPELEKLPPCERMTYGALFIIRMLLWNKTSTETQIKYAYGVMSQQLLKMPDLALKILGENAF